MTPKERARKIVAPLPFGYQTDSAKQLHADIADAIRAHGEAEYRRGLEDAAKLIRAKYVNHLVANEILTLAEKEPTND